MLHSDIATGTLPAGRYSINNNNNIYINGVGGRGSVSFFLYVNVFAMHSWFCLVSQPVYTGSLDYSLHLVVYHPLGSTLIPVSYFLVGNKESELNLFFIFLLVFSTFSICLNHQKKFHQSHPHTCTIPRSQTYI